MLREANEAEEEEHLNIKQSRNQPTSQTELSFPLRSESPEKPGGCNKGRDGQTVPNRSKTENKLTGQKQVTSDSNVANSELGMYWTSF